VELKTRVLKGAMALSAGQAVVYGCAFIRNVILARMLLKADFGIAATFAMTVSALEMMSNFSLHQLVIQNEHGAKRDFQGMAQVINAARGILTAACIYLLAYPVSLLFHIPETVWAFRWLAAVPLAKGFVHMDIYRFEREMKYLPNVLHESIPEILITLAAWPMAAWLKDYSALLWLLIAKWAMAASISHVMAGRRYEWRWRPQYGRLIFSFGWPLLLNGMMFFAIVQGDRFIVGNLFTMEDLGVYSIATALTISPSYMLMRVLGSLTLPLLASAKDDPAEFDRRHAFSAQSLSLAAAMFVAFFAVAGSGLIVFIYGEKWAAAGVFVGWMAAAQGLRVIRVSSTNAALALGDSRNLLLANIARLSGLEMAVIALGFGKGILWIAIAGFAGEAAAFLASNISLARKHKKKFWTCFGPFSIAAGVAALAFFCLRHGAAEAGLPASLALGAALSLLAAIAMAAVYPEFRRHAAHTIGRVLAKMRDRREKR
jgi:O-antigen/teichoic acid export membrane protein